MIVLKNKQDEWRDIQVMIMGIGFLNSQCTLLTLGTLITLYNLKVNICFVKAVSRIGWVIICSVLHYK